MLEKGSVIAKPEDFDRVAPQRGRLWLSSYHYDRLQEEGDSHVVGWYADSSE